MSSARDDSSIVGKITLVGFIYTNNSKEEVGRELTWGRIVAFGPETGLRIDMRRAGQIQVFPAVATALHPAPPGTYEFHSPKERITNPDFIYIVRLTKDSPGPITDAQHEHWRREYRQGRYIEHLSDEELRQRALDVFNDFAELSPDGKLSLQGFHDGGKPWFVLWTHVVEEFELRFGPFPNGFSNGFFHTAGFPDPRSPLAAPAAALVRSVTDIVPPVLVKYGKAEHLERMLELGEIRVSPASLYSDPSLNPAIHDDELALFIQPGPKRFRMDVLDGQTRKYKGRIYPAGNKVYRRSKSNYYVYCLSQRLAPRLFVDFEANACVVIRDPLRFENTVCRAMKIEYPDWTDGAEAVMYLDPLNSTLDDLDVFTRKHFRFAYQREYRLAWLPPAPVHVLQPVTLKIGSLSSYCSFHRLEPTKTT
jgi:hypothetical protein